MSYEGKVVGMETEFGRGGKTSPHYITVKILISRSRNVKSAEAKEKGIMEKLYGREVSIFPR